MTGNTLNQSATQQLLRQYINNIKSEAPEQRSDEWYLLRKNTIGGSEISTVMGVNPYNSVQSLIANKIGISSFNGNAACRWGTLFEHVTEKWTNHVLKMESPIIELGSIPGIIDRQRYSPDGLGVVKLLNCDDEYEEYIILFEFKAPSGTLPNGKIPKHYIPQVQTGMLSIPIVNYTIFVNNCYRKCSLLDFTFNNIYDRNYHAGDFKKRKLGLQKVYACGIICFYQTNKDYLETKKYYDSIYDNDCVEVDMTNYNENDYRILIDTVNGAVIDFGSSYKIEFDRMLQLYDEKKIKPVYFPIKYNYEQINKLDFIQTHNLTNDQQHNLTSDQQHNLTNDQQHNLTSDQQHNLTSDQTAPKGNINLIDYAESCINTFEKKCKQKNTYAVGYLPWKLMISDIILESRDCQWKNKIIQPLTETLELLNQINTASDPIAAYYNKYPALEESNDYLSEMSMDSIFN